MAINRRSLMGGSGQTAGTISAKSMRSVPMKDSIALVKSLDSINKNLVSINNLLQKNATIDAQKSQEERREKRKKEENLLRQSAETGFELFGKAGRGVAGFGKTLIGGVMSAIGTLKNSLVGVSKGILGGIADIADPFVEFFTLGFIGWFSNKVINWFGQNKEEKKKQIKSFIPKILSILAIAGGVLLALNVGIPVILGLVGTLVSTIPIAVATLLNPLMWKPILIGAGILGGSILLGELNKATKDFIAPGSVQRNRIEELRKSASEKARQELKSKAVDKDYQLRAGAVSTKKGKFIESNGRFFSEEDIRGFMGDYTGKGAAGINDANFVYNLVAYAVNKKDKLGRLIPLPDVQGEKNITAAKLRKGESLGGMSEAFRNSLADTLDLNVLAKRYQYFTKTVTDEKAALRQLAQAEQGQKEPEIKSAQALAKAAANDRLYARNALVKHMESTSKNVLQLLEDRYGITIQNLQSESLTQSAFNHNVDNATRALQKTLQKAADPYIAQAKQLFGQISGIVSGGVDTLAEGVSKIDLNINVQQTLPPMGMEDDPTEIPPPSMIDPYDPTNPFLAYATKVYALGAALA